MSAPFILGIAIVYLLALFAIASLGDRDTVRNRLRKFRPLTYSLALAVYCTSWTFFGSVGLAATSGFDFLTIYIGAAAMIALGYPMLHQVVTVSKAQNITSIADFMSARYGKSQAVGTVAAIIAVVGVIPYIALQLKAVSLSLITILDYETSGTAISNTFESTTEVQTIFDDVAFFVAMGLAIFAILFGARQIDATKNQDGLVLAVATESIVKLIAFIGVGLFVTYAMFNGFGDIWSQAKASYPLAPPFFGDFDGSLWMAMCFLSFVCIVLLPRQFHVLVVENQSPAELKQTRWMFPLYLVLINLFVVPIALAGLVVFQDRAVNFDMLVILLPLEAGSAFFTALAFVGGFSAATAMVIVSCVALSIMITNEIAVPLLLRRGNRDFLRRPDAGKFLLTVRRGCIVGTLILAYAYYRVSDGDAALAAIGLLSFAAIAQLAPAFFGGLFWRRATAAGAIAGMCVGFLTWGYTLLLPTLIKAGLLPESILTEGPFGFEIFRPEVLFYLEFAPLTHGIIWSMSLNLAAFILVSIWRESTSIERLQATLFTSPDDFSVRQSDLGLRSSVTVNDVRDTVSRYLGYDRTERAFREFALRNGEDLSPERSATLSTVRFAENLLASAIGAASSRIVLSLLLKRDRMSTSGALKLLDDASTAIQYNRDLLQTALDHVGQGIATFDKDLRLVTWNRQFRGLLELPATFGIVGVELESVLRHLVERGEFGDVDHEEAVRLRLDDLIGRKITRVDRLNGLGITVEFSPTLLPTGGCVITFTDITDKVKAQEKLYEANVTLEERVKRRTEELERLNTELEGARTTAEGANESKTRFLAAASHDVMQPLNAARLYNSSLLERRLSKDDRKLAQNIEASLGAAEEILSSLLDISRLDSGTMKSQPSSFPVEELLQQIIVEFQPAAESKDLDFRVVHSSVGIRSDRRLLRRVLHNMVSNAIKYTPEGGVLVGCRRRSEGVEIVVCDTGPGIPKAKQDLIFEEFQRLNITGEPGLGLGLSIVRRIAGILNHPISLASVPGRGSVFSITVPQIPAEMPKLLPAANDVSADPTASAQKPLQDLRILCIDNDSRILDSMETLLENWGCHVITAQTARDAIHKAQTGNQDTDIALIDYHLDAGTGIDALKSLRWTLDKTLPAILITADRSPEIKQNAEEAGLPILPKPVRPAALRALLQRLVAQHKEAAE